MSGFSGNGSGSLTSAGVGGTSPSTTHPTAGKRTQVEQANFGAAPAVQQKAGSAAATAAQPSANAGAVGPPAIEIGDQEIGTQTFHEAIVWNTETIEANV